MQDPLRPTLLGSNRCRRVREQGVLDENNAHSDTSYIGGDYNLMNSSSEWVRGCCQREIGLFILGVLRPLKLRLSKFNGTASTQEPTVKRLVTDWGLRGVILRLLFVLLAWSFHPGAQECNLEITL